MSVYRLDVDSSDWNRYTVEGKREWWLPPLSCRVCGSLWGTVGEAYPTVSAGSLASDYPLERMRPIGNDEFEALQSRLRPQVPPETLIDPGAGFGPFVGRSRGRFFDFVWHESWTLFLTREAAEQLREHGVALPRSGVPKIVHHGRGSAPDLLEPEALPLFDLAREGLKQPDSAPCPKCGRQPGGFQRLLAPAGAGLPEGVDLCRGRNNPALYLVSERFAAAVQEIGLTGCRLQPLPTA